MERLYKPFLKRFLLPLIDLRRHTNYAGCLRSLKRSQWFSSRQVQEIQNRNLRALLKHAYETVPFYRERFRRANLKPTDVQTVDDLVKFPSLSKREITENFSDMVSSGVARGDLVPFSTGGSTGVPLKFYKDKRAMSWETAATSRNYEWAGLEDGEKFVILWGSSFDYSVSHQLSGMLHGAIMRYQILPSSMMSERSMSDYVRRIREFKPRVLKGYASALVLFARYVKAHGVAGLGLESVISTAESLRSADRLLVEEALDCSVFDTYGSREIALIAGECEEHVGLHVSAETVVVELVRDGERAAGGELGEILVTCLQNYGMPLIRYSIGDTGRSAEEACSCGRGLPLMKSVDGRVTELIRLVNGGYASAPGFTLVFSDLPIERYQLIQKRIDSFIVKIVKREGYSSVDEGKILARLRRIVGDVDIRVEYVGELRASERSGKFLPIRSEVPFSKW